MDNGFRPILIGLLIFSLIAIGTINIGLRLASENNVNQSISDNPAISSYANSLNTTLEGASETSTALETAFTNSTISVSGGILFLDALGGLWKSMKSIPITIYNLTIGIIKNQLLGDTAFYIIFGTIGLIVIISLIFAVWKLLSQGESG